MLFVEKFGGSSLAGVERVRCAARLIADTVRAGHSVAAVLSAQGKTTDALLSTAAHYSRSPSKRELDMLLATGEQASVALMAMTLEEMGLPAVSLTGWQAGVGTDETYGDAHIRRLSMERVRRELALGAIVAAENITISDEELEEEYKRLAEQYHLDVDKVKAAVTADSIRKEQSYHKAEHVVSDSAKVGKAPAKKKSTKKKAEESAEGEEKPKKTARKGTSRKKVEETAEAAVEKTEE